MDIHKLEDFANPVPTLHPDVCTCDGIPHAKWNFKLVTLRNEARDDVANVVLQSVDLDVVVDNDGKPRGNDRVSIQIAQSLHEAKVPTGWM